ncbi:MAG: acetoacetate--CoA ligase [Firmicutes bacterium]|nr:acetoacetate--CoA ligase [Bacillota bacterium]
MREGEILWRPSPERAARARLTAFRAYAAGVAGRDFADYGRLWRWSVDELEAFWQAVWDFSRLPLWRRFDRVLGRRSMPGAEWFPGARLNYVDAVAQRWDTEEPALIAVSEARPTTILTGRQLLRETAALAAWLRGAGVVPGDTVAAYLPNVPEAVIAFLAAAAVGAVWTVCSPDFGEAGTVDRLGQARPKVLFACDGYRYAGRAYPRLDVVERIRRRLDGLEHTVLVPVLDPAAALSGGERWEEVIAGEAGAQLEVAPVPADHPLWILYSSGTTGPPKAIVHGHAGIVAEHWKALALHLDLGPQKRFFWYTTTGWMMWNFLVSGLLVGASVVLYDGSPTYPDPEALWRLAEEVGITHLGTSAAYLAAMAERGVRPADHHALARLEMLGSTGSPLGVDGFEWAYRHVREDLWLASVSGGTDVCSLLVGANPLLPVAAGEIQCRCLGVNAAAFDPEGRPLVGGVGELVVTDPMPSMPLGFLHDPEGARLREAYFATYPGVWRHGDWVRFTPSGSCVIYGRSDATINRRGVRIGTSEIYRAVARVPGVRDSLAVDLEGLGGRPFMALFVALEEGVALDEGVRAAIARAIREDASPRHVPDAVYPLPDIPRTLNGKKLEVPVRRLLLGERPEAVVNWDSVANPSALEAVVALRPSVAADAALDGKEPDGMQG